MLLLLLWLCHFGIELRVKWCRTVFGYGGRLEFRIVCCLPLRTCQEPQKFGGANGEGTGEGVVGHDVPPMYFAHANMIANNATILIPSSISCISTSKYHVAQIGDVTYDLIHDFIFLQKILE